MVGIERAGNSIINPGPDEELLPGDQVLLLGQVDQIGKAKSLLTEKKGHENLGRFYFLAASGGT